MSLANTLLNGGAYGVDVTIEASKYSHSAGATRIAMESVAELHDIFMESFYNTNQAELAAATEGVALEGSQYEAVHEAAISNAFAKIKDFMKKLWAKVKAFFHNVKRYMDAMFKSGSEFVKKYAQDIRNIGTLKDFEYKMYKYDNKKIDTVDAMVDTNWMDKGIDACKATIYKIAELSAEESKEEHDRILGQSMSEIRKTLDRDNVTKDVVMLISDSKCKDPDEFDEWLFGSFRSGATGADDKEDISITNVSEFVSVLNDSSKLGGKLDKISKNIDNGYGKAIKAVDKAESDAAKAGKGSANIAEVCRLLSSMLSIRQTHYNKLMNAWKAVAKERDTAYKSMIMAAFAHAKKQKKSEKK